MLLLLITNNVNKGNIFNHCTNDDNIHDDNNNNSFNSNKDIDDDNNTHNATNTVGNAINHNNKT